MRWIAVIAVAAMAVAPLPASAQRFLKSPLGPGFDVYGAGNMNSVLDHSLRQNANGIWQHGTTSIGGGNGVVTAFNRARANGTGKPTDQTCIGHLVRPHRARAPEPESP